MDRFYEHLQALRRKRRQFIICADWNTCHKEIDLKNWRSNQKNSGFLPIERAWLDRVYDELGYVDSFRVVDPGRIATPGGRIAARPGPRTWAGVWTTR
jgi:exodeoxyribonuclease-3